MVTRSIKSFLVIITICLSLSLGQEFFSDKQSVWIGGSMSYSNLGMEDVETRLHIFQFSPYVRVFVAKYFMLGPRLQWTGIFEQGDHVTQTGFGMDLGYAVNKDKSPVIPFGRVGGQFDIYGSSFGSSGGSEMGFTLPIGIGLFIKTKGLFAIQIEPNVQFKWTEGQQLAIFSFSLGFGGISNKFAISGMAGSGGVHY